MGTRYGDAKENGQLSYEDAFLYESSKRRTTRQYGQAAAAAAAEAAARSREAPSSAFPQPPPVTFNEFTRESLAKIQRRRQARSKRQSESHLDPSARAWPEPDPCLASGQQLPPALIRQMPPELMGKPIEDIDPFYSDQETFVIISRGKELTRFSAKKALYLLGPFHPIRRIVLYILVSSIFNLFVIMTILANCILMTFQGSEMVENTEIIFTIIYTTELGLKVLARGFILDKFTYLRDPWNWLDFLVIIMAYLTIVIEDLGNLSVMRTFRVLRALKTVAIIPGMKTIVGAVIDSVKNLKDVVVLTLFSLSVFSLLGLQIYMGILTQKCIKNGPNDMNDTQWFEWCNQSWHWLPDLESEIYGAYQLCGNATGAQSCPPSHTCLQGFGPNPDYGFTNFDNFGWALICSFRLMTQDFWEGLYMQILKTAGSWHILFFIVSIFLVSIYLMNLILAIVAMSYNELQRRAEEEEEAAAEDEAAFLESCRALEYQERLSQFSSRSTPELAASYRPSVEIGLVGQSLLASLCQNGLLGQQVHERLEQQLMLAGFNSERSPQGAAADSQGCCYEINRSHSLSVNLDYRRQSRLNSASLWQAPGSQLAAEAAAAAAAAGHFFDPLMMAASMTELRRKSSVRTNESCSPANSRTGSLLGQRRLLPNIGVTGNRLDRHSIRLRRHKLSPHYTSGSLLMLIGHQSPRHRALLMDQSSEHGSSNSQTNYGARPLTQTRSSAVSERDLQALKQKAAMIRINETLGKRQSGYTGGSLRDSGERCNSDHMLSIQTNEMDPSQIGKRSSIQINPLHERSAGGSAKRYAHQYESHSKRWDDELSRSEAAICEQPTRAHPFGRPVPLRRQSRPTEPTTSPVNHRLQRAISQRRGHSTRRNSAARLPCRRCSVLSTGGASVQLTERRKSSQSHCVPPSCQLATGAAAQSQLSSGGQADLEAHSSSGSPAHSAHRLGGLKSSSMRTLHQRSAQNSPTELAASGSRAPHRLAAAAAADNYLQPADRMHHLSVENFQQFGAARPGALTQQGRHLLPDSSAGGGGGSSSGGASSNSNSNNNNNNTAPAQQRRVQSMSGQGGDGAICGPASGGEAQPAAATTTTTWQSLGQRERKGSGAQQEARASFSRIRQSIVPGSQAATAAAAALPFLAGAAAARGSRGGGGGGDQQQPGAWQPGGGVRRMSRDFVRHAGDWSRLSMSANVDLRRLLRLWSHTNPYQASGVSPRPSIGSCSIFSQANQSARFGSPTHSIAAAGPSGAAWSDASMRRHSSMASSWQAHDVVTALAGGREHRFRSDARAYGAGAALPLDDSLTSEEKLDISARDKCIAYCLSCLDVLCIWQCCGAWLKLQRLIALLVFDPFTELFIILCILINTLFMALDSDDADEHMRQVFERGNYFFTATFAVEASMKIVALSPKFYFREGWNVFDSIIVALSLLELGLEGVYGLSVLRSFRLLRVFKLAKSWPTLNLLISIMGKAVGDLGNLTFVLAIIVFIFAVMGMQVFGSKYLASSFPDGELPRWNFTDFMHSFMIVFRILCAEWIEPMWDCLLVAGWPCVPFFLIAVTVGNLVVLNLFLALLLASFGASNLSSPQADNVDTKKLQEAIERFKRLARFLRRRAGRLLRWLVALLLCRSRSALSRRAGLEALADADGRAGSAGGRRALKSHIVSMSRMERLQNIERRTEALKSRIRRSPEHHYHLRQLAKSQLRTQTPGARHLGGGGGYGASYAAAYRLVGAHEPHEHQQHQHQQQQQPRMLPNIPIIVNEASEINDEPAHFERIGSLGAETPLADCGPPRWPVAINETNSLDSEISLSAILGKGSDENGGASSNDRHSIYSSNMQTIREDSHDDSCMSLSSNSNSNSKDDDAVAASKQAAPVAHVSCATDCQLAPATDEPGHPLVMRGQKSLSMNPIASSRDDADAHEADKTAELEPEEPERILVGGAEGANDNSTATARLRQPLLARSRSQPEHLKQAAFHEHEQQAGRADGLANLPAVVVKEEEAAAAATDEERPKSSLYLRAPKRQEMEEEDEKTLQHIESYIEKCICVGILCLKWFLFRQHVRKIVEHKLFDQCVLILIIISSGTLALEDKHLKDRPTLKRTLDILDTIFTITFSLEMIFKWLAFGMRRYFGNIWSWLDFVIVLVSLVNLLASILGSGKIQALKTMRTLRAMRGLRPLRALQRFQGMRVVVNALIQAIPSIFNVLLVCLIFWLIFSIMGVQMFGGKFWRCVNPETRQVVDYEIASNRFECIDRNLSWSNPQINFDNVLNAYLALFQVATFKGWIDIMNSATDSRMREEQPIREANIYMHFYFVFFVIFGSFFTLNLFIGVIIDNFNEQKKKTGGSLEIFMTEDQKKYYHAMKKMRSKRPTRAMTRPKFKPQAYMFNVVTSKRFDLAIMIIIGLNMFVMALEHYGQSSQFNDTLERLNLAFISIFTLECVCKIFAMRHFYFREPWNIFDFIVVDLSILGVVMKEYVARYFVSPTLLRVVRVVKVGRVLRLVKAAKGIRTLLFALAMSLPALFNICLLLFLVMFIYAIFGMSFFMNVRKRRGLDDTFNFDTFLSSIIVLFQMSTSAGWDLVLDPLMDEENDCVKSDPSLGIEGTCGNKGIAIFFLVSYVIVTFLIIINMYIAVILENYSQATEDVQQGLTDDDYEMYYEIWQKFDPDGTQYLPYERLSDFVDSLEPPLRIAKPNELALVVLDINIYQGNQCYCVDILDALTKYFFTRKGLNIQVNEHLRQVQSSLHETPFERITTTYLLKREHYCARLIQNCWRKWRQRAAAAAAIVGANDGGGVQEACAPLETKQQRPDRKLSGFGIRFQDVRETKQQQLPDDHH